MLASFWIPLVHMWLSWPTRGSPSAIFVPLGNGPTDPLWYRFDLEVLECRIYGGVVKQSDFQGNAGLCSRGVDSVQCMLNGAFDPLWWIPKCAPTKGGEEYLLCAHTSTPGCVKPSPQRRFVLCFEHQACHGFPQEER